MGPTATTNENGEENLLSLRQSYQIPSADFSSTVRYKRTKNHFSRHPIHYWMLVFIITFLTQSWNAWKGTLPTVSTATNVAHLATASADIWQVAARKQTAQKLYRTQMLTWLLISLHHILHKNRSIMPQTEKTIYNVCNRLASHTVHNTIPLNAINTRCVGTFQTKTSIKYWDSELIYCKPQNVH